MLSFINNIIDRCFFTLSFILGVQLPAFINDYLQQLSGHVSEAQLQLDKFNQLAEDHYNGKLELLISSYKSNDDQVIIETGTVIETMVNRLNSLESQFNHMNAPHYVEQLKAFLIHADINIIKQTMQLFTPSIPLTINALVTGFAFAFSGILCKVLAEYFTRKLAKRLWRQPLH